MTHLDLDLDLQLRDTLDPEFVHEGWLRGTPDEACQDLSVVGGGGCISLEGGRSTSVGDGMPVRKGR